MQRNNRTHLLKCVKTNPNQESIVAMIRCVQTCTNAMNGVSKDVEACMELCVRSLSMRRSFKQSLFQSEFDDLRYAQRNDLICLFIFFFHLFSCSFVRSVLCFFVLFCWCFRHWYLPCPSPSTAYTDWIWSIDVNAHMCECMYIYVRRTLYIPFRLYTHSYVFDLYCFCFIHTAS